MLESPGWRPPEPYIDENGFEVMPFIPPKPDFWLGHSLLYQIMIVSESTQLLAGEKRCAWKNWRNAHKSPL